MTDDHFVHESATVSPDATIGRDTKIWDWAKVREGAQLGAGCIVGQGVYIDTSVRIGDRCKLQNGVSVYQGVTIDDDVFVGPAATFTNDKIPRAFAADWEVSPTHVESGASIGANATIVCGIRIGHYAMIAAGSVVTRDVPPHALVMGNPARIVDYVTQRGHRLNWDLSTGSPSAEKLADLGR
jgi:acetyltransferase-like isoleucine patch superfamily enzyme